MNPSRNLARRCSWYVVCLALFGGIVAAALGSPTGVGVSDQGGAVITANPGPSAEQIKTLMARAAENQHNNDRAIDEYERIEHVVSRKDGENSPVLSDRTERVMPSGTGTIRLLMEENGNAIAKSVYQHELQGAIESLELFGRQNDRVKADMAKADKRRHDRAELVDAATKAFHVTWAGRETRGSRTLAKFILDPDPEFKPTSRMTAVFEHVRGTLWVDEAQSQFARLEVDITTDMAFAGGVAGKVYRGGHFVMEQNEVAPGLWLPTFYGFDVDGRKFVFSFAMHERIDVTRFRRLGPPAEAVGILRNELNSLIAEAPKQ